jgi:hypothetical protein
VYEGLLSPEAALSPNSAPGTPPPTLGLDSVTALLESLTDTLEEAPAAAASRRPPGHGLLQGTLAAAAVAAAVAAAAPPNHAAAAAAAALDQESFVKLYALAKQGALAGLAAPPRSFALLVNCRRRKLGWKALGEELLRRDPKAIRRTNQVARRTKLKGSGQAYNSLPLCRSRAHAITLFLLF